jgi:hypothetical protein
MKTHSGAKPESPRASLELFGTDNGVSATALKQISIKKILRNPKTTSVAGFSNLSLCLEFARELNSIRYAQD